MAGVEMKGPAFSLGDIDRVIHSPARLLIMKILFALDEADMVFLKAETSLTWGNLSVQIKNLENAGYVAVQKKFDKNRPRTLIRMTIPGRMAFKNYCERLKELLF